jgi:hypothetical protein
MNGTQKIGTSFFSGTSRPKQVEPESPPGSMNFTHTDQVLSDPWLTPTQKREVLASWASDVRAVPDAPALRQLDNGTVVRVGDVLRALRSLDVDKGAGRLTGRRIRFPSRPTLASRRSWPNDDDDPPPCPALIARPPAGPLSGGAAVDPGLVLAA